VANCPASRRLGKRRRRWLAHEGSALMSAQQFIVDRLNEPPFNMRLTLVAFDEKSPFELLEIVNAIMAQLSTDHQVDLRDETPDATANRMTDFLKVLNFKQTLDKQIFKQALLTLTRTRT
jgi:intraflagellar transport protein 81